MRKNILEIYIFKGIKREERGVWQKRRKKIKQRDKRRKTKEKEIKKGGYKIREKIKEIWLKKYEKKKIRKPIFYVMFNLSKCSLTMGIFYWRNSLGVYIT